MIFVSLSRSKDKWSIHLCPHFLLPLMIWCSCRVFSLPVWECVSKQLCMREWGPVWGLYGPLTTAPAGDYPIEQIQGREASVGRGVCVCRGEIVNGGGDRGWVVGETWLSLINLLDRLIVSDLHTDRAAAATLHCWLYKCQKKKNCNNASVKLGILKSSNITAWWILK